MDTNSIETSFCFRYLSYFVDLKPSTIDCLLENGYSSAASLLALNLDLDLNQLPNLLMAQKSILREALIFLKNELKDWVRDEMMTHPSLSGSFLQSTPISKKKKHPLVSEKESFKEFIETTLMEVGREPSIRQNNTSTTVSAVKESVDSGIDESALTSRLRKRRALSDEIENNEEIIIKTIDDSKREKTLKLESIETKTPKRRNRFRLSTKKPMNKPKNNILSQKQTNSSRKMSIDIDINDSSQDVPSSDLSEDNKKRKQLVIKSSDVSKAEKKSNESITSKKREVLQLIREVSKRVNLREDKQRFGDLSNFFKCVEIDSKLSPFISCNLCVASKHNRLLTSSQSSQLKSHLMSKLHKTDPLVKDLIAGEGHSSEENGLNSEESFGSDGKPPKSKRGRKKSEKRIGDELREQAMKDDYKVFASKLKINFDEKNDKYLAEDKGSQNGVIVVRNYRQCMEGIKAMKAMKTLPDKEYKCTVDGCKWSFDYPFSLKMHLDRSHKTTEDMSFQNSNAVINNMNNYVHNYMKSSDNGSNEDSTEEESNEVIPVGISTEYLDGSATESMMNGVLSEECVVPNCKYRFECLSTVKTHMYSIHELIEIDLS